MIFQKRTGRDAMKSPGLLRKMKAYFQGEKASMTIRKSDLAMEASTTSFRLTSPCLVQRA